MSTEVHMFLAIGQAAEEGRYPKDEMHPLLIFVQQATGSGHDFGTARDAATKAGWSPVDFTKAGTLPPEAAQQTDEPFASRYATAVREGEAVMVYDTVVQPAPKKK